MYNEGRARIKYLKDAFLNPEAKLSRDISVAFVNHVASKGTNVLDSTAATGVRGIRYYLESMAKNITFLEINDAAYRSLRRNVAFNKIRAKVLSTSIQEFANTSFERFDIIDFDPFGGVATNLPDLLKVSKNGTYLLVTATDTAVLCGAHPKACMRIYDAKPLHNELSHETGIRILIGFIARAAAQFNFGIDVLLSFTYKHYMRIFLRLRNGAENSAESVRNLGYVYYCNRCSDRGYEASFFPSRNKCGECSNPLEISGKLWLGNLYSKRVLRFIKDYFKKKKADTRSTRFLGMLYGELDIPLYYSIPKLTRKLKIGSVSPREVIHLLEKKGFKASLTHMENSSIKTDANISDVKTCIQSIG